MLSARSGALPFVQHSYAGLHSTSGVSGVRLRFAPADTRHPLRSAAALLRYASLSLRPLGRSKKRCLGTATQSLGVLVRCRLRRPLSCQPYPTSFSFGEGACSSPPLRKNERQRPPEQTCWYVLRLAAARYENPLKLAELLIQMARYAFMIIASDNHAYRSLTPLQPRNSGLHMLILLPRHHYGACRFSTALRAQLRQQAPTPTTTPKSGWVLFCRLAHCSGSFLPRTLPIVTLSCSLATTTGLVGSAPPYGRSFTNKPLPRPPPLKAVRSLFVG